MLGTNFGCFYPSDFFYTRSDIRRAIAVRYVWMYVCYENSVVVVVDDDDDDGNGCANDSSYDGHCYCYSYR